MNPVMNKEVSGRRRLGSKVYVLPKDIWVHCRRYGVTDTDVERHYNRYMNAGIPITKAVAALRALEDKLKGGMQ